MIGFIVAIFLLLGYLTVIICRVSVDIFECKKQIQATNELLRVIRKDIKH